MEYLEGKLKCGCYAKTTFNPANYVLELCPLHKAAPLMYEALERAINLLELAEKSPHKVKWGTRFDCLTEPETITESKQVLAKAEIK